MCERYADACMTARFRMRAGTVQRRRTYGRPGVTVALLISYYVIYYVVSLGTSSGKRDWNELCGSKTVLTCSACSDKIIWKCVDVSIKIITQISQHYLIKGYEICFKTELFGC